MASFTGVALYTAAWAAEMSPTSTMFWMTSLRRWRAAARVLERVVLRGARTAPTSSAASGSVSWLTGLLKNVWAAVWML